MPPKLRDEDKKKHEQLKDELATAMQALDEREIPWILEGAREHLVECIRKERLDILEIKTFGALVPRHHSRGVAAEEAQGAAKSIYEELLSLERRLVFVDALLRLRDFEEDKNAAASITEFLRRKP